MQAAGIRSSSSGESASNPSLLLSPLRFLHQRGKFICAVGEHNRGEAAGSGCAVLDLAKIQPCKWDKTLSSTACQNVSSSSEPGMHTPPPGRSSTAASHMEEHNPAACAEFQEPHCLIPHQRRGKERSDHKAAAVSEKCHPEKCTINGLNCPRRAMSRESRKNVTGIWTKREFCCSWSLAPSCLLWSPVYLPQIPLLGSP